MKKKLFLKLIITLGVLMVIAGILLAFNFFHILDGRITNMPDTVLAPSPAETADEDSEAIQDNDDAAGVTEPDDEPIPPDVPEEPEEPDEPEEPEEQEEPPGLPPFEPYAVESTAPEVMLASYDIMVDGQIVESFTFPERIDFGYGETYSQFGGITTFRGNNLRDCPSYGFADIQDAKFGDKWSRNTGSFTAPDGAYWSGHGWTGQPLIVKWPKQTREIMNMHDWAKEQDELVEVVYASMDGNVYFTELETGTPTRDKLNLGFPFKGSGALDPRGYPLLYVGAGYGGRSGAARIFIISLVNCSILHTFGNNDSFAPRGWTAADASALVSAETDQLIYPSENGTIYIIKLNSEFDPVAGTMTIEPSTVKWRFRGRRSQSGGKYWLGMEDSAVIWRGHLFISDNGGHLICLDLNTLKPVWVQDTLDDTNCSPVMELEDGHPYLYISTSFHGGWRASAGSAAVIPIWKIDAVTGEIVWQTDYNCYTIGGVSGGVLGTAAVGKNELSELVYVPVARTPGRGSGILAALDKRTGEAVWEFQTSSYAWSSPVCVYDQIGKGYIVYCNSAGNMYLLDGLTGEVLDTVQLGGNIEASPAIYENTVVVGTRAMKIWGVTLT